MSTRKIVGWGLVAVGALDSVLSGGLGIFEKLPGGSKPVFSFIPTSGGGTTGPTVIDLLLIAVGLGLVFYK